MSLQISSKSRPYGILSNGVLPFRQGKEYFPSVDHFMMASMLRNPNDKANLLSYSDLYHAKIVYNQLDEAQYRKLLEDSCVEFYKKLCRDTSLHEGKTKGTQLRELLRHQSQYVFQPTEPSSLSYMLGLMDGRGFNIIGKSLETLHFSLKDHKDDLPKGLEYLFWKLEGKKPSTTQHFRLLQGSELNPVLEEVSTRKIIQQTYAELAENDEEWEDVEAMVEEGGEAIDYLEDVPPSKDIPTPIHKNKKLPEHLHFTEGVSKDVLETEEDGLEKKTNPLEVFKIMKVAEYLTGLMNTGKDIGGFLRKTVDQIFYEYNIFPEIVSLSSETKRYIYKDCWDMFRAKTLPFYPLVRLEILYPSSPTLNNLVGFIRKEKIKDLNSHIGYQIQAVLFRAFLEQTVRKHFPDLDESLLPLTIHRESKRFSMDEFQQITNHLYHLYFQGKFTVSESETLHIRFFESQRKSEEEIEDALRFIPHQSSEGALEVNGNYLLDPLEKRHVTVKKKVFHDLFQYLYFQMFQFFGDVSAEKAYQELHHNGVMLPGNSPLLSDRLHFLVQIRRRELLDDALSLKAKTYPQILEMLVYLKARNTPLQFTDPLDSDTARGWMVQMTKISLKEENLMKIIMKWTKGNFEKSIFLFSFLKEFFSILHQYKTLHGKRLSGEELDSFMSCFFKNLQVIRQYFRKDIPTCSNEFKNWIESEKAVVNQETENVWSYLYPYIYQFTLESFQPNKLFQQMKAKVKDVDSKQMEMRTVRAFMKLVHCSLPQDEAFTAPSLYLLAQIFTGKQHLPVWRDPTFVYSVEEEKDNAPPLAHLLPMEIRDRIPMGRKKTEKRTYRQDLIHTAVHHLLPFIKKELKKEQPFPEDISQLSFALASVLRHTTNPRRVQFFLA